MCRSADLRELTFCVARRVLLKKMMIELGITDIRRKPISKELVMYFYR